MRRFIIIILFFSLLWCSWWGVFGWGLKSSLETWFGDRRDAGWQADFATLELGGFPAHVRADLGDIVLADTSSDIVMNLPKISISAPTYWPGYVTVALPRDPIVFVTSLGRSTLQVLEGAADLQLHPGPTLELERISAVSGKWSVLSGDLTALSATDLVLTMDQFEASRRTYKIKAQANDLQPGEIPRAALRLPEDWPLAFDTFTMDGTVTFDKPWDITALEQARPQPTKIKLTLAEAVWSGLRLFFAANLEVDSAGTPTGTVNIQAENWPIMLELAERSGALPSALRQQLDQVLSGFARFSGDLTALDIQMNLRGGLMFVGFIPIGPAPRINLR